MSSRYYFVLHVEDEWQNYNNYEGAPLEKKNWGVSLDLPRMSANLAEIHSMAIKFMVLMTRKSKMSKPGPTSPTRPNAI